MKIAICDICVAEGKLNLAKYRVREKRMGLTVSYCTEHKPIIEKAKAGDDHAFAHLLINADNGYNALLAKA